LASRTACQPQAIGSARAAWASVHGPARRPDCPPAWQEVGKAAFARRHGDDLPVRAEIVPALPAGLHVPQVTSGLTVTLFRLERARYNGSGHLVSQNERRRPPFVMAEKGMHVGAADARYLHLDQRIVSRATDRALPCKPAFPGRYKQALSFCGEPPVDHQHLPVT
jgi:hypothetical protein